MAGCRNAVDPTQDHVGMTAARLFVDVDEPVVSPAMMLTGILL
jgi:hypothetical protein